MQYQKYQRKIVYVTPNTYSVCNKEFPNAIRFDSVSEYKCFMRLKNIFKDYTVIPHLKHEIAGERKWCVDFTVIAYNRKDVDFFKEVRSHLFGEKCAISSIPNNLLIEYKGIFDENFKNKFEYCAKYDRELSNSLILLGSMPTAYVIEDLTKTEHYIKPVFTSEYLERVIKCLKN